MASLERNVVIKVSTNKAVRQLRNLNKEFDELDKSVATTNRQLTTLDKKLNRTEKELSDVSKQTDRTTKSLSSFSKVAIGVAAALGTQQYIQFSDALTSTSNRLRTITETTQEYVDIQQKLLSLSQESRSSFVEVTDVYARFARATEEAGVAQADLLKFTETLTKAFKLEGATTAEAGSALIQLSQAFRSGRLQGEEFRAVSESSGLVLKALSKELGVTTGELKKLSSEGKITSDILLKAVLSINEEVAEEFKRTESTFSEAFTLFSEAIGSYIDEIDRGIGVSRTFKDILIDIAGAIRGQPPTIKTLTSSLAEANAELADLNRRQEEGIPFLTDFSDQIEVAENRVLLLTDKIKALKSQVSESAIFEGSGLLRPGDVEGQVTPNITDSRLAAGGSTAGAIDQTQFIENLDAFKETIAATNQEIDRFLNPDIEIYNQFKDSVIDANSQLIASNEQVSSSSRDLAGYQLGLAKNTIGLISNLAKQGTNFQKALFLGEKGIQIAETLNLSRVAATRALAELGPIAGPPAAASALTFGKVNAALIAAQGISGVFSGGGGAPSAGGLAPTSQSSTFVSPVDSQRTVSAEVRGLSELANELARFDPDEPIPAIFAQRVLAGLDDLERLGGE